MSIHHNALRLGLFAMATALAMPAMAETVFPSDTFVRVTTYEGYARTGVLNAPAKSPRYALILMPGGNGILKAQMKGGVLRYQKQQNFLLRARAHWLDDECITLAIDSTPEPNDVRAFRDELKKRFPGIAVFVVSTSHGSGDSVQIANKMQPGELSGIVHTSSLAAGMKALTQESLGTPQLLVHHKNDGCRKTPYATAAQTSERLSIKLVTMEGGVTEGDPCQAFGYHGYNGIEEATVKIIKNWCREVLLKKR